MAAPPVVLHRPRDFHSCKNHPLSGITLPQWARLVAEHGDGMEVRRFWPRLAFLTSMSVINTIGSVADSVLYGRAVARQAINDEPVFVLGHPRTGTTHLHNLLSKDDRFAYATTFAVGFPSGFLSTGWLAPYLGLIMDSTRPMDNMALAWNTPQEDELAVNQLSAGASPYMPLMFMKREKRFRRWYSMKDTSAAELGRWRDAFVHFCKKVQLAAGGAHKRLLLKSPVHTARVNLLHAMFPRATFIFIHRHPYEVFQSAVHMADAYYWQCYFQLPTAEEVQEFILYQGECLHAAYVEDIARVPLSQRTEVRFEDLNADPMGALTALYGALGWGEAFNRVRPAVEAYRDSLRDFKMNAHVSLTPEAKDVVRRRWRAWFTDLRYDE